jgi:hypothetical protein
MMHVKTICKGCAMLVPVLLAGASMANAKVKAKADPQDSSSIVGQLDAASKSFKNVQASVRFDQYTKVVNDHDISSGTMFVERQGTSETMGASYTDAGSSSPKVLNYGGGVLQLYSPASKQVDVFKAGTNQAKYESFLALGFGGSGKDLQANWAINDMGPEIIDGVKTEKLDLVAKDPGVQKTFSHVTIWVDPTRDVSLKRVFVQPNGDSLTGVFSNIQMNGKIDKKPYAIDPKAKKVPH